MVEVLVAIVLLSFGLVGVAGLQIASVRASHLSGVQTLADVQVRSMMEKIRRNPAGVAAGAYDNVTLNSRPVDPGCTSNPCSATDMAISDVANWEADNARLLPQGTGSVAGHGTGSTFTITVAWDDNTASGTVHRTWTMTVQP